MCYDLYPTMLAYYRFFIFRIWHMDNVWALQGVGVKFDEGS